jgi:pyruvate,orthophosphate dikinase
MGTAVTVQRMVFGNAGGTVGRGRGLHARPEQRRAASHGWISSSTRRARTWSAAGAARTATTSSPRWPPTVWQALLDATARLERAFGDMQDFEFTVQQGVLHLLQTRSRQAHAASSGADRARPARRGRDRCRNRARERTHGLDVRALAEHRIAAPMAPRSCRWPRRERGERGGLRRDRVRRSARACPPRGGRARDPGAPDAETRDIAALELAEGLLTCGAARAPRTPRWWRASSARSAWWAARRCRSICRRADCNWRAVPLPRATRSASTANDGGVYAGRLGTVDEVPDALLARLAALRAAQAGDPHAP